MGRAVGRAGLEHRGIGIAQRHDDQAQVGHRRVHRQQGRFVAAVQRGGGAEHRADLAVEPALEPEAAERIDVGLELCRDGTEARGRAEDDRVGPLGIGLGRGLVAGVHLARALGPVGHLAHHLGADELAHAAQPDLGALGGRALRDGLGEPLGRAVAGIEDDQNLGWGHGRTCVTEREGEDRRQTAIGSRRPSSSSLRSRSQGGSWNSSPKWPGASSIAKPMSVVAASNITPPGILKYIERK